MPDFASWAADWWKPVLFVVIASARFKAKLYDFDIGWMHLRLVSFVGLAKIQYARP